MASPAARSAAACGDSPSSTAADNAVIGDERGPCRLANAAPEGWPRPRDAGWHRADCYSFLSPVTRHEWASVPETRTMFETSSPVGESQEEVFPSRRGTCASKRRESCSDGTCRRSRELRRAQAAEPRGADAAARVHRARSSRSPVPRRGLRRPWRRPAEYNRIEAFSARQSARLHESADLTGLAGSKCLSAARHSSRRELLRAAPTNNAARTRANSQTMVREDAAATASLISDL